MKIALIASLVIFFLTATFLITEWLIELRHNRREDVD